MGDFTKLLGELEELRKASGAVCADDKASIGDKPDDDDEKDDKKMGDKKIEAAAKDGEKQSDKDETFGKAFKVKLEDGTETEAFDGTEMLKALHAENENLRGAINEQNADLAKAMEIVVGMVQDGQAKQAEQETLIKALQTRIEKVSSAGVGRKTMLAIAEKLTPGAGPTAAEVDAATVMMKAQFMAREGKLDWGAIPRIEAFQGRGQLAPADLLARYPELLTPVP